MKNKISTEYAEALFALAIEQGKEEQYYNELSLVNELMLKNPEYIQMLDSPSIELEKKLELLDEAFSSLSENVLSFLKLLTQKGRAVLICACFTDYEKLFNASRLVKVVTVVSVTELTDEEKAKLISKLEAKFKCKIELKCEIDESILGGIIIRTDDTVIDGSLIKQLRDVKEVIRK